MKIASVGGGVLDAILAASAELLTSVGGAVGHD
jgi:hypothetical protein